MRLSQATEAALTSRTGEGARGIAEQLRFNQVLRQGSTVYGDKGACTTRTGVVRGASEEILADTGFTLDKERYRLACNAPGLLGCVPLSNS
jgi:hypothetical protein